MSLTDSAAYVALGLQGGIRAGRYLWSPDPYQDLAFRQLLVVKVTLQRSEVDQSWWVFVFPLVKVLGGAKGF